MSTAKHWPWCVEVKRRESFSWDTFLAGRPSPIWRWWDQAGKQADEMGLSPMLWWRKSREPWFAMSPALAYLLPVEKIVTVPCGEVSCFARADELLKVDPMAATAWASKIFKK